MARKTNKTIWSTIKFPQDFVADISAYSKENGWKSSCEFIMAAMDFIRKHDLDLHGELPPNCQTTVNLLANAMMLVVDMLNEFPEKTQLIQQVNQLKADLSSIQKDLEKSNKDNNSWKKAHDTLKQEKQFALDEIEKQKLEVARLMAMTKGQDERLRSISLRANETLQQINAENSSWGRFGVDGKKLAIALETLRWVASEASK